MRGFLILTAAVLAAIGVGVTVIAVKGPQHYYACPTTKYCLDFAQAAGIRGPVLVPSAPVLMAETGLLVKDRLFILGGPSFMQPDETSQPLWQLRYDLTDPANQRPIFFYLTDWTTITDYGTPVCHRELRHSDGVSRYITSAVAPGGRRFCYALQLSDGHFTDLQVWGRFGPLGYLIRNNANSFKLFPGGVTSAGTLRWVEKVVGSLKVEP